MSGPEKDPMQNEEKIEFNDSPSMGEVLFDNQEEKQIFSDTLAGELYADAGEYDNEDPYGFETTDELDQLTKEQEKTDSYYAEVNEIADNLELLDKILYKFLKYYQRDGGGNKEDFQDLTSTIEKGGELNESQRNTIEDQMMETGIFLHIADNGHYYLSSSDEVFFVVLTDKEYDSFSEMMDWAKKEEIEKESDMEVFGLATAYVLFTSAMTFKDYYDSKIKGKETSFSKSFVKALKLPYEGVKIMNSKTKKVLGYVRKKITGLEIYDRSGKFIREIHVDIDQNKALKHFKEKLTVTEQLEKLRNTNREFLETYALKEQRKQQIFHKADLKLLPYDDVKVISEIEKLDNEFFNKFRDIYKLRVLYTNPIDSKIIEKNGLQLDTEILKSLGLEKYAGDSPRKPGALIKSLSNIDLQNSRIFKHFPKVYGVTAPLLMLAGTYWGLRYLGKREKENEIILDVNDNNDFLLKSVKDSMILYNEHYQHLMDVYLDPLGTYENEDGEILENKDYVDPEVEYEWDDLWYAEHYLDRHVLAPNRKRMRLIKNTLRWHKEAVAHASQLMIMNGHIINSAFKNRENPEDSSIQINPFISIKWDSEKEKAYLEYPNEEEFIENCNFMLEMAEEAVDYLESEGKQNFDDQEEFTSFVAWEQFIRTGVSSAPYVGGFYDLYTGAEACYRGDSKAMWNNYLWGGFSVLTDPFMFGAGAGAKAGSKTGLETLRAGDKSAHSLKIFKKGFSKANEYLRTLEKKSGKIFMGALVMQASPLVVAKLGLVDYKGFSGRYYADSDAEAKDINYRIEGRFGFQKDPEDIEERTFESMKKFYESKIDILRYKCKWKNMRYEIIDKDTIRVYRVTSDESITLKRHPVNDPYIQENEGSGIWELKGLDKAYDTFEQAVAMANLVNDAAEVIRANDYEGGSDEPFEEDDGNIDFDLSMGSALTGGLSFEGVYSVGKTVTQYDLTMYDKDEGWLEFYEKNLNIPKHWIVNVLNAWYKNNF